MEASTEERVIFCEVARPTLRVARKGVLTLGSILVSLKDRTSLLVDCICLQLSFTAFTAHSCATPVIAAEAKNHDREGFGKNPGNLQAAA